MGLLKKLFGGATEKKEEKVLPWIELNNVSQLQDIEKKSKSKVQVIFKHSTRCGVSRMVINQFVASYNLTEEFIDLYYLDLLNYREVSDKIAEKFQVWHESPQLLVIKNAVVVAHASHGQINAVDLKRFVDSSRVMG
ncbi:bacillithiol system redox-active protein YtxJ [Seonamhaeicola sediminis]|uniref:Bacillithiol system redox-active protein YtxJ n=1 Tax=Seonamhaeicola sediminis TaxID=2528206 RepID=A0A562YDS5_9FLAO|nr:bacillithiol system redox-active protein YtxJ [Seonamhaeicola sediminis]TWO32765.1 bacillithiol system redox-active protein YtxJ [Seonamhaeicola sediminis]